MGSIVRKPKSTKNYINGKDFYKSLVEYNKKMKEYEELEKPRPQISRYIGECIMLIANNLGKKFNFVNYSFNEEMKLDAIEKMVESVHKYDVNYNTISPNPLGYFTQIAWNQFIQRIEKEKRQQYIKHKNFERNFSLDFSNQDMLEGLLNHDEHNRVIDSFENPQPKAENNYARHSNLDYSKNRRKKALPEKDKNE